MEMRMGHLLVMSVPGLLFGFAIDEYTRKLQEKERLGRSAWPYALVETVLIFAITWALVSSVPSYASEFQVSMGGLFFVSYFWGMLNTYFENLKSTLHDALFYLTGSKKLSGPNSDFA